MCTISGLLIQYCYSSTKCLLAVALNAQKDHSLIKLKLFCAFLGCYLILYFARVWVFFLLIVFVCPYVYLLWLPHYMSKLNNKYETDFKK